MKTSSPLVIVASIAVVLLTLTTWIDNQHVHHPGAEPLPSARGDSIRKRGSTDPISAVQPTSSPDLLPGDLRADAFKRFDAWVDRYLEADPAARATRIPEGLRLAERRRRALHELIAQDPEAAISKALPYKIRHQLPVEFGNLLEERPSFRGDFVVLGNRPFTGTDGRSVPADFRSVRRLVTASDGRVWEAFAYGRRLSQTSLKGVPLHGIAVDGRLALDESPLRRLDSTEPPPASAPSVGFQFGDARTGSVADPTCGVSGLPAVSALAADVGGEAAYFCESAHVDQLEGELRHLEQRAAPAAGSSWSTGRIRILFVPVRFPDAPETPITESDAREHFRQVAAYFRENSGGAVELEFVLAPVVTVPGTTSSYRDQGTTGQFKLRTDAREAVRALNDAALVPENFDLDCVRHTTVFPQFAGSANVGGAGCWLQVSATTVTCHELGHNLGLHHANAWIADAPERLGLGRQREYGDPFDVMGGGTAPSAHFGAARKISLGWLNTTAALSVSTNGTYRLTAHDSPGAASIEGPRVLQIARLNGEVLTVEARTGATPDAGVPSVFILYKGALADATPNSSWSADSDHGDAALQPGRVFRDPEGQVWIQANPVTPSNSNQVDVTIHRLAATGERPPVVSITPSRIQSKAGTAVTFEATVQGETGVPLDVAWDFSDGTGGYGLRLDKAWARPGLYLVTATAYDLHGNASRAWATVRLGNPRSLREVYGRVTRLGEPLSDATITIGERRGFTDRDGRFAVVGLMDGVYVTRLEHPLFPRGREQPLTIAGGSITNADFNLSGPTVSSVRITTPAAGAVFLANRPLQFDAEAVLEEGASIAHFEFILDDTSIPMDPMDAHQRIRATLREPPAGNHRLVGVATDAFGIRVASVPIEFQVLDGPPANDSFASRIPLDGAPVSVTNLNLRATREPFESGLGDASVWYRWTAPDDGVFSATAPLEQGNGAFIEVSRGDQVNRLTGVNNSGGLVSLFSARRGLEYNIRLGTVPEKADRYTFTIDRPPPPANDRFTNSRSLGEFLAPISQSGSNVRASREPGEPTHGAAAAVATTWYNFVSSASGLSRIRVGRADARLALYRGTVLDQLQPVVSGPESITWFARAGEPLQLAVATGAEDLEEFNLVIERVPFAGNDTLETAYAVQGKLVSAFGNTRDATRSVNEPELLPGAGVVWWIWTAAESGPVRLNLATTTTTQTAAGARVFAPRPDGSLADIASGTNETGPLVLNFDATAGVEYRIAIASSKGVEYALQIAPRRENDNFADATVIAGDVVQGQTYGASMQAGEPFPLSNLNSGTVWYRWVADVPATVFVSIAIDPPRPELVVYTGTAVGALTRIATATSAVGGVAAASFTSAPGNTYYFRVAGLPDRQVPFTLSISRQVNSATAPNDQFANRSLITVPEFTLPANTSRATRELGDGEPRHAGRLDGSSLWWEWIAPESGGFAISATSKPPAPTPVFVGVYEVDWANALVGLGAIAGDEGSPATAGFHAEVGRHYYFVVDQPRGRGGPVSLSLKRGPANDDFADARPIAGAPLSVTALLNGASLEPDELPHGAFDERASVWFRWTAPETRGYELFVSAGAQYSVAAYQGSSLTNLARQTPISISGTDGNYTSLRATAGQSYVIAVTSPGRSAFNPAFYITPAPANDQFAGRETIAGDSVRVDAISIGATLESGEPPHSTGTFGASVWWSWTAPVTGGFFVEVGDLGAGVANLAHSGAQQPRIAVYEGTQLHSLVPVARGELGRTAFLANAGTTYAIAVADAGQIGTRFTLQLQRGPLNDTFSSRDTIEGNSWTVPGSLRGATLEPGEPAILGRHGAGSTWWEWTAPSTGGFALTVRNPTSTAKVAVFSGASLATLNPVPPTESGGQLQSSTTFHAVAGQSYQIAVIAPGTGNPTFELSLRPGAANDEFSRAIPMSGSPVSIEASTEGCSIEPGEPLPYPGVKGTLWYRWTPAESGRFRVSAYAAETPIAITAYAGTGFASLRTLDRDVAPERGRPAVIQLNATQGIPIYLSLVCVGAPGGNARLDIGPTVAGDDFADRIELPPGRVNLTTNLPSMSAEPDDPARIGPCARGTAWFAWRAPRSSGYGLRVRLEESPAIAAVFRGSEINRLQSAGTATASAPAADACINFRADAGEWFAFLVSSTNGPAGPAEVQVVAAAENDDFATPATLPALGSSTPVSSLGATFQATEPRPVSESAAGSLWWTWTPPYAGPFVLQVFDDSGPSIATIHRGDSLTSLQRIAASSAASIAAVTLTAEAGATYRIAVAPTTARAGNLRLVVSEPPANDAFAARTALSGYRVTTPATCVGATREPGEPSHGGRTNGASVWFTWTAPDFGRFVITDGWVPVGDPLRDIAMRVFTGTTVAALTEVPLDDAAVAEGQPRAKVLAATRGVTYQIAIDAPIAALQDFTLRIAPKPLNDDLADSMVVTGDDVLLTGDNSGATPDFIPGARAAANSIWFSWVAPSDGYASLVVAAGEDNVVPVVNLHYEDQLGRLNWLGSGNANPVTADFFVSGGTTYHFAVGTQGRPSTNLVFAVQLDPLGGVHFLDDGTWFKGYPFRWTVGPLPPWLTQEHTFRDGPDAVRSGPSVLGTTWMETAVEGPARLRFWWRVSCHPTEAFLAVMNRSLVGGDVPLLQISGERGWQPVTLDLPPGRNLIRWAYTRRTATGILGRDAGWIDNVEVLPPTVPAANFDPPSLSFDAATFHTVLRAAPDRLSTVEVSEDLRVWTPWFSQVPTSGRIEIPAVATTNRARMFLRAITP